MLETIYNDFTTKLVPKIAEGMVITKDYFMDLFGRYVKYLIVTDSINLGISVLVMIVGIVCVYKGIKNGQKYYVESDSSFALLMIGTLALIIGFATSCYLLTNLIKDIYIPEVRVFEQISGFNQKY